MCSLAIAHLSCPSRGDVVQRGRDKVKKKEEEEEEEKKKKKCLLRRIRR
jgi:hypothetical protein